MTPACAASWRPRALLAAAAACVLLAPTAAAAPLAEVLGPNGKPLAATEGGSFSYPADGFVVSVAQAATSAGGVDLRDVSLLGGRISATRIVVPNGGRPTTIDGLIVDGKRVAARPNALIPLDAVDYLVTAQTAVASNGYIGRVALRLTLSSGEFGVPAGTQVLVGLAAAAAPTKHPLSGPATPSPLAVLGFTNAAPATLVDFTPPPFVPGNRILGERAVTLAEQFLGVPYVWGGANPTIGFDCSGLVQYVYGQLGVPLTHYTGAQYHEGVAVPTSQLQPGDLVFFEPSPAGPQHVGIYIGDGQFVHAPQTGDVVKISSLQEPPYANDYAGAVRPTAS